MLLLLILMLGLCVTAPPAGAKATTIVVPDDCRTVRQAIARADNGDTVYIKSGSYSEAPLAINRSISLIGEGAGSTRIDLITERHVEDGALIGLPGFYYTWYDRGMSVLSDDFTLSGLSIATSGGDINITGSRNQITDNSITATLTILGSNNRITDNHLITNPSTEEQYEFNIAGNHCNFSANAVQGDVNFGGQYDIVLFNNVKGSFTVMSDEGFFYRNTFSDAQYGEFRVGGDNNIVCSNVLDHYGSGLVISGSGNRALLNNITYCRIGVTPSADSAFYGNYIAHNEWTINSGGHILNPNGNLSFLVHNNFVDNHYYTVQTTGMPQTTDYFDNGGEGNYWNSYSGSDADGDGIGDSPFYLDPTHLDRYPLMAPFNLSTVEELFPDWLLMPEVQLINPQDAAAFAAENITVEFIVNKQATWMGYSLDGQSNKTTTGNLTLTNLPVGTHSLTIYAKDAYGNQAASQTVTFTITQPTQFPTALLVAIAACLATAAVVSIVVLHRRKIRMK